jgi:hypothetical protein
MASTYSDRLKLELMETGANANTWGNNTNTNLETLDAFTAGYLSKSVAGSANVTLTTNNADPTAESSNKVIEFTGTLTGDITVFVPAVENNYIFFNNTSGSFTLTVAPTGHGSNGSAITQGAHTIQYCTGDTIKDLFSGSLGDLTLVSGGTFTGNAAGASALNASNVSSGTIADARLTANVTLNNASTISAGTLNDDRLTANVTLNNASTISAGTLASDRLPTVPTTKGGTGLTSIGSAGQVLKVAAPGSDLEFGDAGGGGNYIRRIYTSPATWTYDASIQAVKVTVVGGGGNAGNTLNPTQSGSGGSGGYSDEYLSAPALSTPVSVTVGGAGGSSSFGGFLSATGGNTGAGGPGGNAGNPGSGSGGNINEPAAPSHWVTSGQPYLTIGNGMVYNGLGYLGNYPGDLRIGQPGEGFGGGGRGACARNIPAAPGCGGSGTPGVVIVEEFY